MNKEEYEKYWSDEIFEFSHKLQYDFMTRQNFIDYFVFKIQMLINSSVFFDRLKSKFDKGSKEHGQTFHEVDFDKEIESEFLDICNYFIGKLNKEKENEAK